MKNRRIVVFFRRKMNKVSKLWKALVFLVLLMALIPGNPNMVFSNETRVSVPSSPTDSTQEEVISEAISVVGEFKRMKRSMTKPLPEGEEEYLSTSPSARAPDAWRKVTSSSGSFIPEPGVDPRMLSEVSALKAAGRKFVYGYILMDEYLSEETRQELEAFGVTFLSPRSDLYKVKFPLDIEVLENIAELSYVEWVGYNKPNQKLDVALRQSMRGEARSESSEQFPIIINLFDDDPEGNFKRRLEATGAILDKYDAELRSYRAVASQSVINQIILLDFVSFVEPVRIPVLAHDQSMATIGVDYIRPGALGTIYSGHSIPFGIMDTGFMMDNLSPTLHEDLDNKDGCGRNFTSDGISQWDDQNGHGTHVLATATGTGAEQPPPAVGRAERHLMIRRRHWGQPIIIGQKRRPIILGTEPAILVHLILAG